MEILLAIFSNMTIISEPVFDSSDPRFESSRSGKCSEVVFGSWCNLSLSQYACADNEHTYIIRTINFREYRRGNQKLTIQRNWQQDEKNPHHNMCWTTSLRK